MYNNFHCKKGLPPHTAGAQVCDPIKEKYLEGYNAF